MVVNKIKQVSATMLFLLCIRDMAGFNDFKDVYKTIRGCQIIQVSVVQLFVTKGLLVKTQQQC